MGNSRKIRAKFVHGSCKVRAKFAAIRASSLDSAKILRNLSDSFYIASDSQPIRTKFARDSCKIRTRFVQDSYKIRARFVPVHAQFGEIRAWFVPNSCLIRTKFVEVP